MAKTYDPTPDSSPGSQKYRTGKDGDGFDGLFLIVEEGQCGCGCTEAVSKGKRFRMGHDARLKGKLIRAGRAGIEVHVFDGGGVSSSDPLNYAKNALSDALFGKVKAGIERPEPERKVREPKAPKDPATKKAQGELKVKALGPPVEIKVGKTVIQGVPTKKLDNGKVEYTYRKASGEVATIVR